MVFLKSNKIIFYGILVAISLAAVFGSLFVGRYPVSAADVPASIWAFLSGKAPDDYSYAERIILFIRMPRALLGLFVGGSLAISGAALQGLFRNPLVSSGMLGVSSGAGFGAALAIIIFGVSPMTILLSFIFGIIAVLLSFMVGRIYVAKAHITLVLGGVVIGSLFSAMISFLKYIADPYDELPAIVFWLMGSLASARYQDILSSGIPMVIGIAGIFILSYRINVLSMGEKEANSLGINVPLDRMLIVIFTTLATAGAVSVSGNINWVGLIIPHIGRMIVGSDNRWLLPFSFVLGGCFLIGIDIISRTISGSELPLGILTAFIGAPFFIYLLRRTKARGW